MLLRTSPMGAMQAPNKKVCKDDKNRGDGNNNQTRHNGKEVECI